MYAFGALLWMVSSEENDPDVSGANKTLKECVPPGEIVNALFCILKEPSASLSVYVKNKDISKSAVPVLNI